MFLKRLKKYLKYVMLFHDHLNKYVKLFICSLLLLNILEFTLIFLELELSRNTWE